MHNIGVEVEFTGMTRYVASMIIAEVTNGAWSMERSVGVAMPYDIFRITSPEGVWSIVRDRSITSEYYYENGDYDSFNPALNPVTGIVTEDNESYKVELVSPVLTLETLPILFSILEALQKNGAIVNSSTGIHIHVDAPQVPSELASLVTKFCQEQEEIVSRFDTFKPRLDRYCMLYPPELISEMSVYADPAVAPMTLETLVDSYTNVLQFIHKRDQTNIENPQRYYALNLDSITKRGTVEFRFFNSTLLGFELDEMVSWVLDFCYGSSAAVVLEAAQ